MIYNKKLKKLNKELNKEMLNNKELIHQDFKKINKINIMRDMIELVSLI